MIFKNTRKITINNNEYEIVELDGEKFAINTSKELGKGKFGTVYVAYKWNDSTGGLVGAPIAVKVAVGEARETLARECWALKYKKNDKQARLYFINNQGVEDKEGNISLMMMQYIDALPISDKIKNATLSQIAPIWLQIELQLNLLSHYTPSTNQAVFHSDIKIENILHRISDPIIFFPYSDEEYKSRLKLWQWGSQPGEVLFAFSPSKNQWIAHWIKPEEKPDHKEVTIEKYPDLWKILSQINGENCLGFDTQPLHTYLKDKGKDLFDNSYQYQSQATKPIFTTEIIDFGGAHIIPNETQAIAIPQVDFVGTEGYVPPEIYTEGGPVAGSKSDGYSAAVIFRILFQQVTDFFPDKRLSKLLLAFSARMFREVYDERVGSDERLAFATTLKILIDTYETNKASGMSDKEASAADNLNPAFAKLVLLSGVLEDVEQAKTQHDSLSKWINIINVNFQDSPEKAKSLLELHAENKLNVPKLIELCEGKFQSAYYILGNYLKENLNRFVHSEMVFTIYNNLLKEMEEIQRKNNSPEKNIKELDSLIKTTLAKLITNPLTGGEGELKNQICNILINLISDDVEIYKEIIVKLKADLFDFCKSHPDNEQAQAIYMQIQEMVILSRAGEVKLEDIKDNFSKLQKYVVRAKSENSSFSFLCFWKKPDPLQQKLQHILLPHESFIQKICARPSDAEQLLHP